MVDSLCVHSLKLGNYEFTNNKDNVKEFIAVDKTNSLLLTSYKNICQIILAINKFKQLMGSVCLIAIV